MKTMLWAAVAAVTLGMTGAALAEVPHHQPAPQAEQAGNSTVFPNQRPAYLASRGDVLPDQRPTYLAGNSTVFPSQRPSYLA